MLLLAIIIRQNKQGDYLHKKLFGFPIIQNLVKIITNYRLNSNICGSGLLHTERLLIIKEMQITFQSPFNELPSTVYNFQDLFIVL